MKLVPRSYFFDDMFNDLTPSNNMKCDVYEKDGAYNIEVDVPGFKKEDISIEVKNGYLTITASKESSSDDEGKNYIYHERKYGKYERSFYLGELKTDDISASFEDGTLKIVVPKVDEDRNKKTIEIR